jgi:hypothetical protein
VQNAVVGVVKEQKQLLGQGWMALQVPLQAKPLGSLRNCRAETVPALKTAMTMVPNKKFCVVFLMIDSPFPLQDRQRRSATSPGVGLPWDATNKSL